MGRNRNILIITDLCLRIQELQFDILKNGCFRKSVVETQISHKMIPPKDTNRVGISYKQM